MYKNITAFLFAITSLLCLCRAVTINEIMSSNGGFIADNDGDYPDWIELYNPNPQSVNLTGYYLSDSSSNLTKWQFPAAVINGNSYLLIWASGKNKVSSNGQIHTSFKLSASGEPLSLTAPDGITVIDSIPAVVIPRNVSYGAGIDGDSIKYYFSEPTAAATNNNSAKYTAITQGPQFSVAGGFFTAPVEISLNSAEPDAVIYYTLDGSEPDPANLTAYMYPYKLQYPVMPQDAFGEILYRPITTYLYTQPFIVSDRSQQPYELAGITTHFDYGPRLPAGNIFKGTAVRARAYKPNYLPSEAVTNTYFIHPDIQTKYDLPVISVVMNENYLFDYYTGIYVPGFLADQWRLTHPATVGDIGRPSNSNYAQSGELWERSGHIEMFGSDGSGLLSQNVGIRINGARTRHYYRKSLRLYAQTKYGTDSEFAYPFFDGLEKKGFPGIPIDSFSRIILRNSGDDYEKTLFRDAVMQHLVKHLPIDSQASAPAVHFVNGEYWGIANIRERLDEYYFASHYGIDPENIVILEYTGQIDTGYSSDNTHLFEAVDFAKNNDMSAPENYQWIKNRIDVENLALYYAIEIYYDNTDWPGYNLKLWRDRTGTQGYGVPYGHDGRWRWILYDTDFGMNLHSGYNHTHNSLNKLLTEVRTDPSSILFLRLLNNDEFRYSFINAFADNMNTSFVTGRINAVIDEFNAKIESSRNEHYNRWQSGNDRAESMKTFATLRPQYMTQHILEQFAIPNTADLGIRRNNAGGKIKVNNVVIDENTISHPSPETPYPWSGTYYSGIPVTVTAIPQDGYRFSHWQAFADVIEPVNVENHSFELPGTSKQLNWSNVPGWHSDTQAADSGVESNSTYPASDGLWTGFMKSKDPAVWNTTSYIIQPGDRFRLKIDARRTVHGVDLYAKIYYNDNGTRIALGDTTLGTLSTTITEYEFTVSSELFPEAIGKNVGIELQNTTSGTTWLAMDNVRLDRIYEVPISNEDWPIRLNGQDSESQSVDVVLANNMAMKAEFTEIPQPEVIHFWDFNNSASLLIPAQTIGSAAITVAPGASTTVESGTGQDFIDAHLRVNNPIGAAVFIQIPTTGYENIILKYDTRRSGQGAGRQIISYTTDGTEYTPMTEITVLDAAPVTYTLDFSSIEDTANNSNFVFKIEFEQASGGTGGNNRFDNITAQGTVIEGINMPPTVSNQPDTQYTIEQQGLIIDLDSVFEDPDNDPIIFNASIDKTSTADVYVIDGKLHITGIYRGDGTITVTADDGINPPVGTTVRILVYPKVHKLADGRFTFGYFSSLTPENIFPENMLFVQSNVSDPTLEAPLDYAYWIAHDDYHADDASIIGLPYNTTGRSRLNGLGDNGISFINTGRNRDVGAAIVAIDTTGIENAAVKWLGGTILQNSRRYAIRLQYRIGCTGAFLDLLKNGAPIEYIVEASGNTQRFKDIELPQECLGQSYLQLQWRYYFLSVTSGSRAQLRLDDITIAGNVVLPENLTAIAQWWLSEDCQQYNNCDNADISRDGQVDIIDFAYYADSL